MKISCQCCSYECDDRQASVIFESNEKTIDTRIILAATTIRFAGFSAGIDDIEIPTGELRMLAPQSVLVLKGMVHFSD